ncbi:MAG: NTP transferase domain-containing protein [Myxococcota bacterium]
MWAVSPARYAAKRLPGKVLADLGGRSMLEHVWRRVSQVPELTRVVVATDDDRVAAVAQGFGAEVVRTGPARDGTHRVARAIGSADVPVIGVQADQPLVDPEHLSVVARRVASGAAIATLAADLDDDAWNPARVKVVVEGGRAVAFSRHPIPEGGPYRVHVGIYGFGAGQVARCAAMPRSARAVAEDLEQLTWLDGGYVIHVDVVGSPGPSVDTPADLEQVRHRLVRGPTAV